MSWTIKSKGFDTLLLSIRVSESRKVGSIGYAPCITFVQYWGGYHDACGGYHEYCGVFSTMGDIMSTMGVILSTVGILSIVECYHDALGGYHEYCGCSVPWGIPSFVIWVLWGCSVPHSTHDTPQYWVSPTVLKITPMVLMISPTILNTPMVLKISPTFIMKSPHGTEHSIPRYWTAPMVLHNHYTGCLPLFQVSP